MNVEGHKFYKMSGAGNDFLVFDNRDGHIPENEKSAISQKVCRRRFSVGADGIMLVEQSDTADFRMRYFNKDGTEGEMCGNGARCIARYAAVNGIADDDMKIETMSGILEAEVLGEQVKIRLNPVTKKDLDKEIEVDDQNFRTDYFEQGTPGLPHAVIMTDDLTMEEDIEKLGKRIRYCEAFPKGANVNFYTIIGKDTILNRTYERGVEKETLACGTGSAAAGCAVFVHGMGGPEITVKTKGGLLKVTVEDENLQHIYLTGDARIVYEGILREV